MEKVPVWLRMLKSYLGAVGRHWVGLVAGGLGVALFVLSVARPSLTKTRVPAVVVLLLGLSFAQYRAWRDMRQQRDDMTADLEREKAARPIIHFGRPHVAVEHVFGGWSSGATGPVALGTAIYGVEDASAAEPPALQCARVEVSNQSDSAGTTATAEDVRARIGFNPSGIRVDGKWTDSREPVLRQQGREDLLALGAIDIAPGQTRRLDVAVKYEFEAECFAFSNDSYGSDFRVAKYQLPGNEWRVIVVITGKGVGVVQGVFMLRIGPKGLEFRQV